MDTLWKPGTHRGTCGGGNTLVSSAAIAAIDTMIQEDIPDNAAVIGKYLMDKLDKLQKQYPIIRAVRGRGHIMVAT
jgi:4-aminobutyrate aminotransferase-like enzyme